MTIWPASRWRPGGGRTNAQLENHAGCGRGCDPPKKVAEGPALSVVEPRDGRYGGEQPSGEVGSHPVAGGRQLEPGHPPVAGVSCPPYQSERLQPVTDGGHVASLAAQVAGEVTHRLRFVE